MLLKIVSLYCSRKDYVGVKKMINKILIEAADEAISLLKSMTDEELFKALESCEPTLAHAVNYAFMRDNFSFSSVLNARLLNSSSIDSLLIFKMSRDVNSSTEIFNSQIAMNDSCYALAA